MYLNSNQFKTDFENLLNHDKETFENPNGWREKTISQSPLIYDFSTIWNGLKNTYNNEMAGSAFSLIPNEQDVAESFTKILNHIAYFT